MESNTPPLLSVCLITYNHVNYITQAVEGVLMQQTRFAWDLIIADDGSTDGTRDIIISYQKKYPDRIRLILQEKNIGPAANWRQLITTPKSKYIAYFDGDDFWADPLKLQKQVDILEADENCGFVVTSGNVYDESVGRNTAVMPSRPIPTPLYLNDALDQVPMPPTCSYVFRRTVVDDIRFWQLIENSVMGDLPLIFFTLLKGYHLHHLADVTCSYRINNGGNVSARRKRADILENWIGCLRQNIGSYAPREKKALKKCISFLSERLAHEYLTEKKYGTASRWMVRAWAAYPIKSVREMKDTYWRIFKD